MNGEDYNLNLGEVQSPQQEQAPGPSLSMDEYLRRLNKLGVEGNDAISIMAGNGYDEQQVYNHVVAKYETQREEFLKKQKEAEQRAKEAEQRAEAMSSQKKRAIGSILRKDALLGISMTLTA